MGRIQQLWHRCGMHNTRRAEELVRSEVANLELLPGRDDIVLDVVRYDRGLFSSQADTCLVIQGDLAAMAGGTGASALAGTELRW
mgnify:CR=1 FL=1